MKGSKLVRFFVFVGRWISSIGGISGAVFIFLMTLLITVDVLGRAVGVPTYIAIEMSGYMLVGIVFLGLAYTQRKGGHIKIIMLTSKLSPGKRKLLEIATLVVALIFIGWLAWATLGPVMQNYILKATSLTMVRTPLWIPYGFITVGLVMLGIELMIELIKAINLLTKETRAR